MCVRGGVGEGVMALPVMEFQVQGYKIRKIFAKKSTYRKVAGIRPHTVILSD